MKATTLQENEGYKAACEQVTQLQNELARLDDEIETLNKPARPAEASTGNKALLAGLAALKGRRPDKDKAAEKRAELCSMRETVAAAITPAYIEVNAAVRDASRAYFKSREREFLSAMDTLGAAFDGVLSASKAFQAMRDEGERLGYDASLAAVPYKADIDRIAALLPELRKEADRLRDSLNPKLRDEHLHIRALVDLPLYGLKIGQMDRVPALLARELIRSSHAEVVDAKTRLRELVA